MTEQNQQTSKGSQIKVIKPNLPKGGGNIQGLGETFSPHEFSGSSSLSIPIPASSCRDFTPHLSLNYSSGTGNGPFGLGVEISLPEISRQTSKRIPKYDDSDTFLLTGDDYLVPKLDEHGYEISGSKEINGVNYDTHTFVPRTAGQFSIIQRFTNESDNTDIFWIVKDAGNNTSIFGKTANGRIYNPKQPSHIFKWLLEETFNDKGDHQLFEYISSPRNSSHRDNGAQKYLSTIKYGIYTAVEKSILLNPPSIKPQWHFGIAFDYGTYSLPTKTKGWVNDGNPIWRKDAFSDYRAGFELRTGYLCQNILLFHQFPEEEYGTNDPVLVNVLGLEYDSSKVRTLLTKVNHTGYYYNANTKSYSSKSLPPLALGFSKFMPEKDLPFEGIKSNNGNDLVGLDRAPDYQLVDLFGGGIPGVLYSDGQTVKYAPAKAYTENELRYSEAENIAFPLPREANRNEYSLTDVQGNGHLDLMSSHPSMAGYFETVINEKGKGEFNSWQPFMQFPTAFYQSGIEQVDVTGNGLSDLILIDSERVVVYPSKGKMGFGQAFFKERKNDLPYTGNRLDRKKRLTFANISGIGLPQRVEISNGIIACWSNLGYGNFGKKIELKNAPRFNEDFDIERLQFADVDGSGLADLVYIYPDKISIYLNQSGNGFSTIPIDISLPEPWDNLDQIRFEDILGSGSATLVYTTAHPAPKQWYYDFNRLKVKTNEGKSVIRSTKPYLLIETDNHMGARTQINYASSTKFYLEDQQNGLNWVTRLPFPVQVVESVTHNDFISKTIHTVSYRYHHGYYDGIEREFRGFGRVDRTDSNSFSDFIPESIEERAAFNSPPALTKTWYHTGAYLKEKELLEAYEKEFWKGDTEAYHFPSTQWNLFKNPSQAVKQEAHRTLHGTVLRAEVYGKDGTPWQNNPYTVSESQFEVKQLQEKAANKYAVFQLIHRESISYNYKRNPKDPKIGHNFTLEVDEYGHILKSVQIDYGRRKIEIPVGLNKQTQSQQERLHITLQQNILINQYGKTVFDFHILGVPEQQQGSVVTNIGAPQGGYFDFKSIKAGLQSSSAKFYLIHWNRDYYFDAVQQKELPLGKIISPVLHHRTEFIEFEKNSLTTAFFKVKTTKEITALLTGAEGGFLNIPSTDPNYKTAKNYFWNPGNFQSYSKLKDFYLPQAFFDAFQYKAVILDKQPIDKVPKTSYTYDKYHLLTTAVEDPLHNISKVTKIDYQHLAPIEQLDINQNTSEVLLDPLGMVIASSFYGTENGKTIGFKSLDDYLLKNPSSLDDVFKTPTKYLQGAAEFFFYDLDAWDKEKTPTCSALLSAENYPSIAYDITDNPPIQMAIHFSDGSGRPLQTKVFNDSEEQVRYWNVTSKKVEEKKASTVWITSGVIRYNIHGHPIQKFEPFFSDDYKYVDETTLNQVGYSETIFYDALGQAVLTINPKGYLTKILSGTWGIRTPKKYKGFLNQKLYGSLPNNFIPSPWRSLHFDENDTEENNTYKCFNTPRYSIMDSAGHVVENGQYNVTDNERDITYSLFDTNGRLIKTADQRQQVNDTIIPDYFIRLKLGQNESKLLYQLLQKKLEGFPKPIINDSGKLTDTFQPNSISFLKAFAKLLNPYDAFKNKIALILSCLEAIGDNFLMNYSLGIQIKTISADAGTTWTLHNVLGQSFWTFDSRGTTQFTSYDPIHRPSTVHIQNDGIWDSTLKLNQCVQKIIYGDSISSEGKPFFSQPTQRNLRGKAVVAFDQSGLSLNPFETIHEQSLANALLLAKNYKEEVDWGNIDNDVLQKIIVSLEGIKKTTDLSKLKISDWRVANLEEVLYANHALYDALGRITSVFDPDGNRTTNIYYRSGQLKSIKSTAGLIAAKIGGKAASTPGTKSIKYNAKGQETITQENNGIKTTHTYDPKDFRLVGIKSIRTKDNTTLQNLTYTYDPVGNVIAKEDQSLTTVFFRNQKVIPKSIYKYDTLYRLVHATGREAAGMWNNLQNNQNRIQGIPQLKNTANNAKALQKYIEKYQYDHSGNILSVQHQANTKASKRTLAIDAYTNRLISSRFSNNPKTISDIFSYDLHGNQDNLNTSTNMRWNYRNNMSSFEFNVSTETISDNEYYIYNAGGQRVRKVRETTSGELDTISISEVIYLGGFEIRRKGIQKKHVISYAEKWHWTNIAGCRWGYLVKGKSKSGNKPYQLRYQLTDLLNSSCTELDYQGNIITHEEYYPYGGTSLIAAKSQTEVKQRYYRYSGKEADASGLYYYGMRYYCPWLMRWTCPDPAGTVDGLNIFAFVGGNPMGHVDVGGMGKVKTSLAKLPKKNKLAYGQVSRFYLGKMKIKPKGTNSIKHRGHYFDGFELKRKELSDLKEIHKKIRTILAEDMKKNYAPFFPITAPEDGFAVKTDDKGRTIKVSALLVNQWGKGRANPALPQGGLDTTVFDRGHGITNAFYATKPTVDSAPNIMAENMLINQHYKRAIEEGIWAHMKEHPEDKIHMVITRDYTTREKDYDNLPIKVKYLDTNGKTITKYYYNPIETPKRQHIDIFRNGIRVSTFTLKNSKHIQYKSGRKTGVAHGMG